jgi:hypothetical protein
MKKLKIALLIVCIAIMAGCDNDTAYDFHHGSSQNHAKESKFLYSFGALSDIHLNTAMDTATYCINDFKRAMTYFQNVIHTDFVSVCGDISFYGYKGVEPFRADLAIYKDIKGRYDIPTYTCSGNHDCDTLGYNDAHDAVWEEYTGCKRNFIFEHDGDVFMYLSMNAYYIYKGELAYRQSDLDWLTEKLKKYSDRRVFLWTHLFMSEYSGDFKQIYVPSNILTGAQYDYMKQLLAQYPNVIDFSGHSHFRWYLQDYDSTADISTITGGATMVHLPSCAVPRDAVYTGFLDNIYNSASTDWKAKARDEMSEIGYVDVYDDHVVVHGLQLTADPAILTSDVKNDYKAVKGATFCINISQNSVKK